MSKTVRVQILADFRNGYTKDNIRTKLCHTIKKFNGI